MRSIIIITTGLMVAACGTRTPSADKPKPSAVEVQLCDGHTTEIIPSAAAMTPQSAQALSDVLMAKWRAANPGRDWVVEEQARHSIVAGADNTKLADNNPQGQGYGELSPVAIKTWDREVEKLVVAGSKVFHSGSELGSTIAVSCDMCHPNASNTHPETYPKFQTQIGRTALLRDMINWCLQHPVRAPPMAEDDPRMRAMEAYIIAQRRGTKLDYNRH